MNGAPGVEWAERTNAVDERIERALLAMAVAVLRHWLLVVTAGLVLFVTLPLVAPLLMANGWQTPASAIYNVYRMVCHQEPYRSYFLAGPRLTYTHSEIETMTETRPLAAYVGSSEAGYKVAYCQRDTAMYLAILLVAIAMLVVGRRLPRLSLRLYLVLILPLVVDGLTQLAGLRESTWLLRTLTGGLFGLGSALLLLPEVDRAIQDVAQGYERRLHGPG